MKYLVSIVALSCVLTGCSTNKEYLSSTIPETEQLQVSEHVDSHFIPLSELNLSGAGLAQVQSLLKDAKNSESDHVGFLIISNKAVSAQKQTELTDKLVAEMGKAGYWNSRILDGGVCTYSDAKPGVRIDIFKYEKQPVSLQWDTDVGDCSVEKTLPKKGAAMAFNLSNMIADPAHIASPSTYAGQRADHAVAALSKVGGESSGGGSGGSSGGSSGGGSGGSSSSSN